MLAQFGNQAVDEFDFKSDQSLRAGVEELKWRAPFRIASPTQYAGRKALSQSLIARSIGLDAHAAVDDVLDAIAARDPLLVVGPAGLDEEAWLGELADDAIRFFAAALPKTRSGKIMRRILRKIAEGNYGELGDISTLAEPQVVEQIVQGHQARG